MNHQIETLLSQIKRVVAQLTQPSGDDLQIESADTCGLIRELKRTFVQLVHTNTNSCSRAIREEITSVLVASAPLILGPEDIGRIQEFDRQRVKLNQELAGASTKATRQERRHELSRLDEQLILFLRGVLNDSQKKHVKFKRERKHYVRAMRALGIVTQENACNDIQK
jgi:hypothetical protein